MKLIIAITILSLLYCSKGLSQDSKDWQLSSNSKGVKIFMRRGNTSQIKEVLGLTTIKTSLSALVYLVKDSENHNQWIYANKYASLLKTISNFEWIYYNESEAPWPVSNRDLITHARMQQDSLTLVVRIDSKGVPGYLPLKEGIVRVPKLSSVWVFSPKSNGFVEVQFELVIDLGGNIPAWLVNFSIDRGPKETLLHMKEILQQDKYKNIKLPYIKEKTNE